MEQRVRASLIANLSVRRSASNASNASSGLAERLQETLNKLLIPSGSQASPSLQSAMPLKRAIMPPGIADQFKMQLAKSNSLLLLRPHIHHPAGEGGRTTRHTQTTR